MINTGKNSSLITSAILLVLVAWFLLTSSYNGALNPQSGVRGGDFKFFYHAALRLNRHQPLYEQITADTSAEKIRQISMGATYVYTPLIALMLRPVAAIAGDGGDGTPELALKIWFAVSAASLIAAIALYSRAMRWNLQHAVLISIAAITAFRFWPTVMTFGLGQTNLLLVFTLAGLYWADSRNRPLAAAFFIALGALFKTWFIGFLLYLLVRRAWKATAACIAFSTLGLIILFTVVGWPEFPIFFSKTVGYASKTLGNQVLSQSIAGFAQLHFTANDHISPLFNAPVFAALFKYSGDLLMLAGLGYLFLIARHVLPVNRRLHLSLVSLTVLLLLPYCQNEYLVLVLPSLWLFLTQPALGGWPVLCAALAYIAFTRGGPYYPENAKAYHDGLRTLWVSLPFAMLSLLWLTTMITLWDRQKLTRQTDLLIASAAADNIKPVASLQMDSATHA